MTKYQTKVNEKFAAYDFAAASENNNSTIRVPQFDHGAFLSMFPVYKGIQQFYLEDDYTASPVK